MVAAALTEEVSGITDIATQTHCKNRPAGYFAWLATAFPSTETRAQVMDRTFEFQKANEGVLPPITGALLFSI